MIMKRIFLGAAAAVMTLLSACEAIGPQESEQPGYGISGGTAATQLFTATIGADTKTYLQYNDGVYKTVWSEGDYIYVINSETAEYERCSIVEGVGTTTATFAGTMEADSYMAYFGSEWYIEEGQDKLEIYLKSYQDAYYILDSNSGKYLNMFGPRDFPMIARSDSKTFEFQNLCSVLKVSITGNGESVNDIYFTPNDESIGTHGYASVTYDGTEPVLTLENGGENRELWFDTWGEYLSSEPQDYYIVLPAQTYTGGFTLEICTDAGSKTVTVTEDIQMRRSRIRTLRVDYSEGIQEEDASWGICGSFTDWADGADIPMENIGDGWYVAQSVWMAGSFKLRKNGLWDGSEVGLGSDVTSDFSYVPTNTFVPVSSRDNGGTADIYLFVPGYYDVWYNSQTDALFLMSAGISPFDLPTMEPVAYPKYGYIYDYATVGSMVKITGLVMAKSNYGFIVAMENREYNNMYVYDSSGLCDVELGDIVDVYAPVQIYNGLPELVVAEGSYFFANLYSYGYEVGGETPEVIDDLDSYSSTGYTYIRYTGWLDGTYVTAEDDSRSMKITNQSIFDLTEYDGQMVCVEGYYAGYSTRHNMILKKINIVSEDTVVGGSTEDIVQGESFPVTPIY